MKTILSNQHSLLHLQHDVSILTSFVISLFWQVEDFYQQVECSGLSSVSEKKVNTKKQNMKQKLVCLLAGCNINKSNRFQLSLVAGVMGKKLKKMKPGCNFNIDWMHRINIFIRYKVRCRTIAYVMASNLLVLKDLFHSQRNMEQQCINGMY